MELFINCRERPQPDSQSALSFVSKDGDPEQASCRRTARKTNERFQDDASQREERGREEEVDTQVGWLNLLLDELTYRFYTTKNNGILVPPYWNAKNQYWNPYIRMI